MSFVKIWIHVVFATKNRKPLLKADFRQEIFKHIGENCKDKEIFLKVINGHIDHVHCLISLGKDQTISKVCQLIKGESSFWINNNNFMSEKFTWQDDYFAVSVSESQIEIITKYINNQDIHHSKKTFQKEVEEFTKKYGWVLTKDTE